MSDIAAYRAAEVVGGELVNLMMDGGDVMAEVLLDYAVDSVIRARVNLIPSTRVEMVSGRRILVKVPTQLERYPASGLLMQVLAEVSYARFGESPVPVAIGMGSRLATIDAEAQALQTALRSLMMRPGSDFWDFSRGRDLLNLPGTLVSVSDITLASRKVQVAVDRYNSNLTQAAQSRVRPYQYAVATRKAPTHRVVKIEAQSVRVMTRIEAEQQYLKPSAIVSSDVAPGSSGDANETMIVLNLVHLVQGPNSSAKPVASSITV